MRNNTYIIQRELVKRRIHFLEDLKARLIKKSSPSGYKGNISYLDCDAIHGNGRTESETILLEILSVETEIAELKEYDKILEGHINHALAIVQQLSNSKEMVWYLRDYCGLNLVEIADEIHLSYDRVKHISQELNKEQGINENQLITDTIKWMDGKSDKEIHQLLKELCQKVKQGL